MFNISYNEMYMLIVVTPLTQLPSPFVATQLPFIVAQSPSVDVQSPFFAI